MCKIVNGSPKLLIMLSKEGGQMVNSEVGVLVGEPGVPMGSVQFYLFH